MPPLAGTGKGKKARDVRRSRSRNTTPSSVISAGTAPPPPAHTPFLDLETAKLFTLHIPQYGDILDILEAKPTLLEPKRLQEIIEQLKKLNHHAEHRIESCEKAIRLIHSLKAEVEAEHRERERLAEQSRRTKVKKEDSQKTAKAKKRKDRTDSVDVDIKREEESQVLKPRRTPPPHDTPSPSKKIKHSPGTSSLSEVADSPSAASAASPKSAAKTDVTMSDDDEDIKPLPRAPLVPTTGFFPNPLAPDPIIYHIRDIEPEMSEEEKKEIYSVVSYPTTDLSHQIAGQPPDKDFSNAKPSAQIAFTTFLAYADPFTRPLTEEDVAFLRERGDRTTPFLAVPRGKRTYQEIWAEEDGLLGDHSSDRLPLNQGRGSAEGITDDNLSTDAVSAGPLASRLLSLLKYEHRPPPAENGSGNGTNDFANGDDAMDLDGLLNDNLAEGGKDKPLPPAGSVSDLAPQKAVSQKLDYTSSEERIKSELRHLGLLGQEENPDYDAHYDDDISERLRLLQQELRKVMVINGARKARLLDMAKERLAYQEYSTIHEDLDSQVQQAYLKRTRTLGKPKKGGPGNKPRPDSHIASAAGGFGGAKRDIGDSARMLMDRRKRWESCIGPVFKDMERGIPSKGTTLWDPKVMEAYEKAEAEAMEEEAE